MNKKNKTKEEEFINHSLKNFGYLRVSTDTQTVNSQKESIRSHCEEKGFLIPKSNWVEIVSSSRKSEEERGINDLLSRLNFGDRLFISEISRLARSNVQVNNIISQLVDKGVEVHIVKQNLIVNGKNRNDMITKLILTLFGMMAEFERDILSSRTKDGLKRAKSEGKQVGRVKGKLYGSKYAVREEEITYLLKSGYSYEDIVKMIGFGKKLGLYKFVKSRGLVDKARKLSDDIKYEIEFKKVS